jgi:isocitrate lyase
LKDKNARLDEFFDQYVDEGGSWDFETLNAHRALIDNIDEIANAIYKQGLSDGQRNLVEKAANVDVTSPRVAGNNNTDSVAAQIFNYLNSNDGLRLKI